MNTGRAELGQRVRKLRKDRGKTLSRMAAETGLSSATLSKIETGSIAASYDNLLKVAAALGAPPAALFSDGPSEPNALAAGGLSASGDAGAPLRGLLSRGRRTVTRRAGGELYETGRYRYEVLGAELSVKRMLPMLATIARAASPEKDDLIRHPGEEFVYVLTGRLEIRTEFYAPLVLEPGDSTYFDSTMAHSLAAIGDSDAQILWVSTNNAPDPTHVRARPAAAVAAPADAEW